MKSRSILFVFFVCLLSAPLAFADVTIGNGFSCSGTSLLKGTKPITYKKARSNVETTIEKLKEKRDDAPKNKKQGFTDKINAAKQAKTLLKACTSGNLSDSEVDPLFTQLAAGTGVYAGPYSGSAAGFPLSGSIKATFGLSGTTFTTVLEITGNVGNALDAEPLSFEGDVGGIGFPAQFFLQNTFLGDVTLSFTQNGQLTITNSNTNVGSVTLNGQFSSQTITGSLGGSYKGIPFNGTYNLTR